MKYLIIVVSLVSVFYVLSITKFTPKASSQIQTCDWPKKCS